jgi:hypothetical protein
MIDFIETLQHSVLQGFFLDDLDVLVITTLCPDAE